MALSTSPNFTATPANQQKWIRTYWMQVQGQNRTWTISYPMTLDLDIERGFMQQTANGSFTIYNLGADARKDIFLDWNNQLLNGQRFITLKAGYQSWAQGQNALSASGMQTIFYGFIRSAYSTREGPTWTTKIEAWDGGFSKIGSQVNLSFSKDVPFFNRVQNIASYMPGIKSVYVSPDLKSPVTRGRTYIGYAWDILQDMANYAQADMAIDLGNFYMVPRGASIPGIASSLNIINSQSGLLNTPLRQKFQCTFDMIFEPRLICGQVISMQSIETENNGLYTLRGLKHTGTISGAVDSGCVTSCILWPYPYPNAPASKTNPLNPNL